MGTDSEIKGDYLVPLVFCLTFLLYLMITGAPGRYNASNGNLLLENRGMELVGLCSTPTVITLVILLLIEENKKKPQDKVHGLIHHLLT